MQNFQSDFQNRHSQVVIVDNDSEGQFSYFQQLSEKNLQFHQQSDLSLLEQGQPIIIQNQKSIQSNFDNKHEVKDVDVVSLFCNYKRGKSGKNQDIIVSQSNRQGSSKSSHVRERQVSIASRQSSKSCQNSIWIRDDDFNDGINWSDDEKLQPHQDYQDLYFSKADSNSIKRQKNSLELQAKNYQKPKKFKKVQQDQFAQRRYENQSFCKTKSVNSSQELKAKKSEKSKDHSLQFLSNILEEREDDDRRWFDQVKFEEMTPDEIQRIREEKTLQRRQYQQYKMRYYRKKKMAESRKVFTKSQLESLRHEFEILHNKGDSDEEDEIKKPRRKASIEGLPKTTLTRLSNAYQASTTTISNLYKQWRFDPTLSKPLSRFDRVFTLEFPQKPSRQIVARQRTQQRIETLSRLLEQNPFLQYSEMCQALQQSQSYQQKIQRCTILRLIRLAQFNQKKLRSIRKDCNTAQSITERKNYTRYFRNYMVRDYEIFFYDELLVNQYYANEIGWAKGQQEINYRPELMIDQSIVVLGLLSMTGQLLWDARYGDYTKPQLEQVLKSFIGTVNKKSNATNRVVVINPLNYRDIDAMRLVFQRHNWQIIKLPVNGLQLNPLFTYYSQFRYNLRRKRMKTFQALFNETVNYFKTNQFAHFGLNYITKLQLYLRRAEAGDIF